MKSGVQSFTCLQRAQIPSPWSQQAAEMTKLAKMRPCSCESGSFAYFCPSYVSSFSVFAISTRKAVCLIPSAAALLLQEMRQPRGRAQLFLGTLIQCSCVQYKHPPEVFCKYRDLPHGLVNMVMSSSRYR